MLITNVSTKPLSFNFKTTSGSEYEVQASDDLTKWNKVQTINGTGNEVKFTDTREALFLKQYYRVKIIE